MAEAEAETPPARNARLKGARPTRVATANAAGSTRDSMRSAGPAASSASDSRACCFRRCRLCAQRDQIHQEFGGRRSGARDLVMRDFRGQNSFDLILARTQLPLKGPLGLARPHFLERRPPPHPLGELVGGGGGY